ncbi:4Fe-4S dicluster domain-containing protein [Anaerocolumna sp. AGMB13020]|uniref:4Fe-4S dicluster domain-containing protein n=1 Tax=Anaerocolumna sp. AGMB13020 TaxID=3081750 RepID=UPI0029559CF9|nr:4Fe-4S dicluster domain-containing protein [Anaerocolumna sp. AGMB13020]WOO38803.1 4Fe-4S dicluster domain-containing protein [Anaerocolumna sp. AGMB13020]
MSDKLRPIPFKELLRQSVMEYKETKSFYGVPVIRPEKIFECLMVNGQRIETPFGPAAGPHTQLAQNILAAYAAGARYFELKTVQVMWGEELGIVKPCIYVETEAYNTEWSSELSPEKALEEYIKAWILLHLLVKEFDLGRNDGFVFNMSVGYQLAGIQSPAVNAFLEAMREGKDTTVFKVCTGTAIEEKELFGKVTEDFIRTIPSCISDTVTLSTMHGCPSGEIEEIVLYLMKEKKLNTHLKCNPTLLGYDKVNELLEKGGYSYVEMNEEIFRHDISFEKAVALIGGLKEKSMELGKEFGIKLTNTLPVKIINQELPGEAMYLSGPALYPITIGVAAALREALEEIIEEDIAMSYSGGADSGNITAILETGIKPVTVSTLLLKTGGYKNLTALDKAIAAELKEIPETIDRGRLTALAKTAQQDSCYHNKGKKNKRTPASEYSAFCAKCRQCTDVCPNRANKKTEEDEKVYILHRDGLCNECGNCVYFCPLGHIPYKEKFTLFETPELFLDSMNPGICNGESSYRIRWKGQICEVSAEVLEDTKNVTELGPSDIDKLLKEITDKKN